MNPWTALDPASPPTRARKHAKDKKGCCSQSQSRADDRQCAAMLPRINGMRGYRTDKERSSACPRLQYVQTTAHSDISFSSSC